MNADTFQLPEGAILLAVLHRVNHKTLQHLNVPGQNTNNVPLSIGKNMPIASMQPVGKCEEGQEVSWSKLWCNTFKLLPQILRSTSLQLEPDTKSLASSIPYADIPNEARMKLQELLDKIYPHIISQNAMDISRTNRIKLDIPMVGLPIMSKVYTVLLKYCKFIDHKIKQCDWVSPILVVPRKQDCMETNNSQGSSNFNLQLCTNYRKLNSHIQTAH